MISSGNGKLRKKVAKNRNSRQNTYFRRKVWFVRILGGVLLVIASPIILILVALVRLSSAGPGLFAQTRMGKYGKPYVMYKLRTMYQDAESVSGPVWCRPGDSRITPFGKFLRFLHLDELPQLINVARGEMDLIGPRPERPEIVARLQQQIPGYHRRLRVLPGVTGLAQINLPPDCTTDCVRKKLILDCAYIRDASFILDMRILACTFLRMIGIRHGLAAKWLGVKRRAHLHSRPFSELDPVPPFFPQPEFALAAGVLANGDGTAAVFTDEASRINASFGSGFDGAWEVNGHILRRPK